ncbi:hypothetical protein EZS27_042815 [termite gut metagenome]|uniref:Uncharacterized protein n=2 Tax=termite gut metagenome TaxID=433724 RepID=A0A5J4PAG2_9ZZZZ
MKEVFEAIVVIDESYIGGKPRKENHHNDTNKADTNKRGRVEVQIKRLLSE